MDQRYIIRYFSTNYTRDKLWLSPSKTKNLPVSVGFAVIWLIFFLKPTLSGNGG